MSEEFIIKLISDDFEAGVSSTGTAKSSGSSVGGIAAMTGILGGIGLGIQQLLSVVGPVIDTLLKPIKSIMTGIFKLVGELIRPVIEIITFLLRPVLMLLKPLIQMFKTFLAPFMDIARGYMQISMQQMASGNVTGAMTSAIEAVNVLIGPFIVSLVSVGLQLATTMIIMSMTSLLNLLIGSIGGMIATLVGVFSSRGEQAVLDFTANIQGKVTEAGQGIIDTVNGGIVAGTETLLAGMLKNSQEKYDAYNLEHGNFISTLTSVNPDELYKPAVDGVNYVSGKINEILGVYAPKEVDSGLIDMGNKFKMSFNPNTGTFQEAVKLGLINIGDKFNTSFNPNTGTFPEAVRLGLVNVNLSADKGMSSMKFCVATGMTEVEKSSDNFLVKLQNVARQISSIKIRAPSVSVFEMNMGSSGGVRM